jgi:predicted dehydrogenase
MGFIKGFIKNLGEVYAAAVIAGSYLPEWRRGDYRQVSSARRSMGGGVLLDLVHEIDYLSWFFGMPQRVLGYLNTVGKLDIDTEDLCVALLKYRNGSIITLNLNYLSKKRLRDGLVIGEHGTLTWEHATGQVIYHSSAQAPQVVYTIPAGYDLNETYVAEANQFLSEVLRGGAGPVTIEQAMDIMRVVDVIRQSASEERWVDV